MGVGGSSQFKVLQNTEIRYSAAPKQICGQIPKLLGH